MMSSWSWKASLAGVAIVAATAYALAQMPAGHEGMHGRMGQGGPQQMMPQQGGGMTPGAMTHGQQGMSGPMGQHEMMQQMMMGHQGGPAGQPTMAGQDAFGTIAEVVQILEADPATDWSKVDIGALREHLIDMNEVTLRAVAIQHALDNGVEITVTGEGRTREAIKRMLPAHAQELRQIGWMVATEDIPDGVRLVATSTDAQQVIKLEALGFMGIMVQGTHHQAHHLMMAKGELVH
jgi:hypothetical protein